MSVVQRCADCGRPLVHEADPVVAGKPPPRALLGVSVVVDYGPPTRDRAGGEVALCIGCGGTREIERALAIGGRPAPAPKPAARAKPAPASQPSIPPATSTPPATSSRGKPPARTAPQRPRKT